MELFIQQLANGAVLGSVYALIAIGFTLTFGVLRLLNMAHGELYMLGAFLAYLCLDVIGMPVWVAIPASLLGVFVVAVIIERVAFKPLRNAPHFIPLVSTIAVSTIVLEAVRLAFGPYMVSFEMLVPNRSFQLGLLRVSLLQLCMLALSLLLMFAVHGFLVRSKWGKAIRGATQDLTVSGLLGIDVNRVISLTFAIASVLGAVAGILIAMYFGAIYPNMGFVALVKAFTAAILGGMGSVPGAVLGGFVLGIIESLGAGFLPSGASDALPYVMLFVVLLFMPGGLTRQRSAVEAMPHHPAQFGASLLERWVRRWRGAGEAAAEADRWPWLAAVALAVLCAAAPAFDDYTLRILISIAVYGAMALGVNFILGLAGQLSLSHAAFFAIGAYASALLTTRLGWGFFPATGVGVLVAAMLGALVSLTAFRVRGYYLALVTLAFAEIVRVTISHWTSVTGGMMGIRAIPAPQIGPFAIDSPLGYFYLSVVYGVLAFALYDAMAYSVKGRAMMAMRDDELAARAAGLPVRRLKVVAFTLSAVFPAIGGSIMAHYYSAITPDMALLGETVSMLVIVVIGGLGSAAGALFGSTVVNLLPEVFRNLGDYRMLAYGIILLLMILYQPNGVFSMSRRLARRA